MGPFPCTKKRPQKSIRLLNLPHGATELEEEQNSREGNGKHVRNRLRHVNANRWIGDKVGHDVDQGEKQNKLTHNRHDDGAARLAKGNKGHLAGDLNAKEKHAAKVDGQDPLREIKERRLVREHRAKHSREQHDG